MPPTLSYTRVSTKAATDTVVTARKIGIVGGTTIAVTDTWIREGHRKLSEDSTK